MSATTATIAPAARRAGLARRLAAKPTAALAILVLAGLIAAILAAPLLTHASPLKIDPAHRLLSPRTGHLMGTDHLGRDMLAIVLYGGRTSLIVGFFVTAIAMSVAIALGLLSGFYRRIDAVLMRIVDGLMAFPGIVLATAAAGYIGPSVTTVVLALSLVLIAPALRVVRGQTLIVRELPMIEAARAVGLRETHILTRYILPAVLSPILIQASFVFSAAVLGEAALSFIGLGVGAKDVSWGGALAEARDYIQNGWWIVVFPGAALVLTILSLNLLGDSLRDALDPKLAGRRA
ncbi:ABC transporter permease [Methylocapsa sp. S129]|uniref:ABC transporter permease n=1 Tax=Methylocapsa sp. S129 TaxID=1641869 RepID=UPI001FEF8E06|nr:ABC transporter permease [Methylocapsa sp. S129]